MWIETIMVQNSPYLCLCYLGFGALLPAHHHLHAIIIHALHSLMGRNECPTEFSVYSEIFCDVEFCEADVVASIPSQ
jgi:hypothetical protein